MKSLHKKIGIMNARALALIDKVNSCEEELIAKLGPEKLDTFWAIADGLTEEWIYRHIEGRTSLAAKINTSIGDIEKKVNKSIQLLAEIESAILDIEKKKLIAQFESL